MMKSNKLIQYILIGVGLIILPLLLQQGGNAWVRILDMALLYVLLALGLNIVVGYAGLLDLGYVAFLQSVLILPPCWARHILRRLFHSLPRPFPKACICPSGLSFHSPRH